MCIRKVYLAAINEEISGTRDILLWAFCRLCASWNVFLDMANTIFPKNLLYCLCVVWVCVWVEAERNLYYDSCED